MMRDFFNIPSRIKANIMDKPLVSVIIPCYNVELYIEDCLNSCLNQTHSNIEIICIDNNCDDKTISIISAFQKAYPHITLLKESKQGPAAARNKGIKHARGEWIQFLDADDLLFPNKIEHQLEKSVDNAAFVAGSCISQKTDGETYTHPVSNKHLIYSLYFQWLGNTCSNLYNAKTINKTVLQDDSLPFSEETDFMFQLVQINDKVIVDDEPLTIIRERSTGSINKGDKANKYKGYIEVRLKLSQYLQVNQPEFYHLNKTKFDAHIFSYIRGLAHYDLNMANMYRLQLNISAPPTSTVKEKLYALSFKLCGFKTTETMLSVLKYLLSAFKKQP
ncbi:glycosyltransferase family 2 protein [Carboxylicivirga sp. M1479]|nr:glycosyltransferase family 2 protein [Carboxylicivirga sp. M1479]